MVGKDTVICGMPLKYLSLALLCLQVTLILYTLATPSCPQLPSEPHPIHPVHRPSPPATFHQNSGAVIIMRYTRSIPSERLYLTASAVVMGEVFKVHYTKREKLHTLTRARTHTHCRISLALWWGKLELAFGPVTPPPHTCTTQHASCTLYLLSLYLVPCTL